MKNIKRIVTRFGSIAAMLTVLGVATIAPVAADTIGTSGTLAAGGFTGSKGAATIAFAGKTFTGVAQNSAGTQTNPLTVSDLRGTTNGWSISLTTSTFVNGTTPLANDALSLVAATGGVAVDTTGGVTNGMAAVLPADTNAGAVGLTTGGTPTVIYTTGAATDTSGLFNITPAYSLAYAATDKPGTYSGTLTYTFAQTI